jgi:hypothetical protein
MGAKGGRATLGAAAIWCGLIFGTSSTVVLPHDFFAWIAANVLADAESMRRFRIFWGACWFLVVKGWHAAEFAILFLLVRAALGRFTRLGPQRRLGGTLAFCVLFAMSDEYHQTFVPGRGGNWTDVVIDCLGASTAAIACLLHQRARDRGAHRSLVPSPLLEDAGPAAEG